MEDNTTTNIGETAHVDNTPKKRGRGRPRKVRLETIPDDNPFKNELQSFKNKIIALEEQIKELSKENDTLRLYKVTLEDKLKMSRKRIMALENKWEE
jgi:hypothetical protein